ncbi:hypothetical protein HHS_00970 [Candidatus Pantoea carbekii]|uniref:Rhodanese domain-containing protein n=1 Tax=Candidatus Pantoea carbekii TaxID=1235990 RepID=U3U6V0_9GAMM|nr:hypothetical protein HHS_00970 [Candidatus Pantoea carbekii]
MQEDIIQFASKHSILILVWLLLFVFVIINFIKIVFSQVNRITHDEVIRLINKKNSVVIDIRSNDEYCKGHIIGALNFPAEDFKKNNFTMLKKYKLRHVILVCVNDHHSQKLAAFLNTSGFTKVSVLKGGLNSWNNQHLPLVRNK